MRNMMHELKTPITKGLFIAESVSGEEEKRVLVSVFERMNEIINELAEVEKLSSDTIILNKEEIFFSTLYHDALRLMMTDGENIKTEIDDFKLFADRTLFAIVLKNLLDNAMKFCHDFAPLLKADKERIEIISCGSALSLPLESYTEPFFQKEKSERGFGLGLYIVKTILEIHGFELGYERKDDKNCFFIKGFN